MKQPRVERFLCLNRIAAVLKRRIHSFEGQNYKNLVREQQPEILNYTQTPDHATR